MIYTYVFNEILVEHYVNTFYDYRDITDISY